MKETELLNIVDSYILHITTCKVFRDKIKERILQTISEKIDEELDNIFIHFSKHIVFELP